MGKFKAGADELVALAQAEVRGVLRTHIYIYIYIYTYIIIYIYIYTYIHTYIFVAHRATCTDAEKVGRRKPDG